MAEADPANYAHMQTNRPDATNLFGAMCLGDSIEFQSGVMSATGGTVQDMSERHKERFIDGKKPVVTVPCMQVNTVLKEHNVQHVDVFFLDVEGGEYTVLQTIDFGGQVKIDMFVIEMDKSNPLKDEAIRAVLRSHGYVRPFSVWDICKTKKKHCQISELFVLESVWKEKLDRQAALKKRDGLALSSRFKLN